MANTKKKLIEEIYEEFSMEISPDAIQSKNFGAATDGYIMGYLIERINSTLNARECSWTVETLPIIMENGESVSFIRDRVEVNGKPRETVAVRIRVAILDPDGKVLDMKESWGGCGFVNNSLGDSLKGAQTDAMKKIFSYMGIGNTAFKGRIDDQLRHVAFEKEEMLKEIANNMKAIYDVEPKAKTMCKFISSMLKKKYGDLDDILYCDLEEAVDISIAMLEDKKGNPDAKEKVDKTDNEGKHTEGKADEEEVDLSIEGNDEIPF